MAKLISLLTYATVALAAATLRVRDSTCTSGPVSSNGRNCTVSCGLDHPGGDYSSMYTADFQTCIDTCVGDQKCATAQYSQQNSYCYLKKATNLATTSSNVNSVVCQGSSDPPSQNEVCTYGTFTQNGRSGAILCDTDYPGGDYPSQYTGSLAACQSLCTADARCLTAQYATNTYICYLKSRVTQEMWKLDGVRYPNNVMSIVMNPTTTPSGCMPYAPISPYMFSPGLEQGFQHDPAVTPSDVNGWFFTGYGKGSSQPTGTYQTYVANNSALEGCNSYVATPVGFDPRQTRTFTTTVKFRGLQTLRTYNLTMKVGVLGTGGSAVPPQVQITVAGQSGAVVAYTPLCGFRGSACPIQGIGGAFGQQVSGQFTWNGGSPYINISLLWPFGAASNEVVLDDVQIVPA